MKPISTAELEEQYKLIVVAQPDTLAIDQAVLLARYAEARSRGKLKAESDSLLTYAAIWMVASILALPYGVGVVFGGGWGWITFGVIAMLMWCMMATRAAKIS